MKLANLEIRLKNLQNGGYLYSGGCTFIFAFSVFMHFVYYHRVLMRKRD